jgi:hypothetical protein
MASDSVSVRKNRMGWFPRCFTLLAWIGSAAVGMAADEPCTFEGPPVDQAKCLLRPVKKFGHLGPAPRSLPPPLEQLIGQPTASTVTREVLKSFLTARTLREADLGGLLTSPLSRSPQGQPARYFVIHDTSSPTLERGAAFPPAGMDTPSWPGNRLTSHLANKKAHLFINRLGDSATAIGFETPKRTTKFEGRNSQRVGLFLGIELIQPRRKDTRGIDSESPIPGFTDAQLDRLALVYVAASVRRGEWLIPAFHCVIDAGIPDGHDDPQNFDLDRWAARLGQLLEQLRPAPDASPSAGGG